MNERLLTVRLRGILDVHAFFAMHEGVKATGDLLSGETPGARASKDVLPLPLQFDSVEETELRMARSRSRRST